jgi:hypothetical protein
MMSKVAAYIVNYNMPEAADRLAEYIRTHSSWPVDVWLIDNGSDKTRPAHLTNLFVKPNRQTTNGWLEGLRRTADKGKYFAYWFLITSAQFVGDKDPLSPMASWLSNHADAAGIHPALTQDSTTAWEHLKDRGTNYPRRTWMIDNIASLYRADWFDSVGWFDSRMIYAWGIDLETCWKARRDNYGLWVDERVQVRKISDIGYKMDRMNMTAGQRRMMASTNMEEILKQKYGKRWQERMRNENVRPEWR